MTLDLSSEAKVNECVIFLHGLARSDRSFKKMASVLKGKGYFTINYNYPSDLKSLTAIKRLFESDKQQIQRQYQEQNANTQDNINDNDEIAIPKIDDSKNSVESNNGGIL